MISVIVPVYNVEKTLDRCMQSILNQTYQDFEIILVNDGSTDGSPALCDEYAKKYSNIRVIHKENEGLGPTRNLGILEARGEYIYHCDSDDWIKADLLQSAYDAIVETDADFVVFGYEIFTEKDGGLLPFRNIGLDKKVLNATMEIRKVFVEHFFSSFVMMSACNRLYKRSFLIENQLFFPALRRSQDMAYSFLLFNKAKKISLLDQSFYCYIIQPGVFKGRAYDEMIETYHTIFQSAKETFEGWGLYDSAVAGNLNNYICEQIANYSAYAFAVKYKKDWRKNVKYLLKDDRSRTLFLQYTNEKHSRFMKLFQLGIKIKSKWLLYSISKIITKKVAKA